MARRADRREAISVPPSSLRPAEPLPVAADLVASCLDLRQPGDQAVHLAWKQSLDALPRARRAGALGSITGYVSESVVEMILVEIGYSPVAHHPGPGRHGVDLLMLHLV